MKTSLFDFDLPKNLIASFPSNPRDESKLLVFDTKKNKIHHLRFKDILGYLDKNDVLVLNRSKVIPARICFFVNNKQKEIFILKNLENHLFHTMVKPGKFFKLNKKYTLSDKIEFEVCKILEDGTRYINFLPLNNGVDVDHELEILGTVPLPPYIANKEIQLDQYQTIYAEEKGSVAAPTAGLHFTENLLNNIKLKGVNIVKVLLHVGRGTFLPVNSEDLRNHQMHEEEFEITNEQCRILNSAREKSNRIIAVGTTSVRTLESDFDPIYGFIPQRGATDIFIYPGSYKWKTVDALITNFHLPKSTLIMLVASFLENKGIKNPIDKILDLYELAKRENYRFYSFGDAMFIF